MASLRVKIGDTIEFALIDGETTTAMTAGRVVDVNPSEPHFCTVQLSPYEPLRTLDLRQRVYKVVYAVGEIALVSPRMVGWQIEITNDTQQLEPGVIKRVDADINCALVAFDSGKKEWLDLTLSAFKVLVQHSETDGDQGGLETDHYNAPEASDEALTAAMQSNGELAENDSSAIEGLQVVNDPDRQRRSQPQTPPLDVPSRTVDGNTGLERSNNLEAVQFASKPLPESDVASFDWYSEGGHVEICDPRGKFIEGAILCSKTDTHVHLYNEPRQFFELLMAAQSFKVVIHGLLSLKWIPMGQALEVYSAMTGGFHQGIAIKAAEVSKLTPVRFSAGAVEWLDLSTQTFKLVFLSSNVQQQTDEEAVSSPSKVATSPTHKASQHHHHQRHHRSTTTVPLGLPSLHVGQRIEIFEASHTQFVKYKVADARECSSHEYEFEPQIASSSARISANLSRLRCRIPLTPHMWSEYRHILAGHRIDVYDKAEKTVATAKILEVGSRDDGDDQQHQHAILVRYKDGQKSWIHAQSVKVKLRLQGEPLDLQSGRGSSPETGTNFKLIAADDVETVNVSESSTTGEMWERPVRAETSPRDSELSHQASTTKHHLSRHRSDLAALPLFPVDTVPHPQLSHAASAGDFFAQQRSIEIEFMTEMTQTIPSTVQPLDFSSLRKLRSSVANSSDEPAYFIASEPGATVKSSSSGSSRSSARSRHSDSSSRRSSRLPFSMADVWRQELNSELNQVEFVNNGSGERQTEVPEWLERIDETSGKLSVVHTPSNTLYSVPTTTTSSNMESEAGMTRVSSSRANSSAPGSAHSSSPLGGSGGRMVVPIGPIEAVRVYNMLEKYSSMSMSGMEMLLRGKRALVVGLMNKHSLAANVTQALLSHGAHVVVSSRSALTPNQVKACAFHSPTATGSDSPHPLLHFHECDVESEESIERLVGLCGEIFDGQLDILVHSIAFAPRETFTTHGGVLAATKEAWHQAMDVSAYSLIALTRAAYPLLSSGADGSRTRDRSIMALSYAGASKVMPNYNIMGPAKAALEATSRQLAHELGPEGIRVNCLSPGPMNTVSARGIPGISRMRKYSEEHSPLRRNATGVDVGNLAAFLASDMASAITGQTIYVDGGLSSMAPHSQDAGAT